MELTDIRKLVEEIVRENYLVQDQIVEGTLNEMGFDSLDFVEFAIDIEGDIQDQGYKISMENLTPDMTCDQIAETIHQALYD